MFERTELKFWFGQVYYWFYTIVPIKVFKEPEQYFPAKRMHNQGLYRLEK